MKATKCKTGAETARLALDFLDSSNHPVFWGFTSMNDAERAVSLGHSDNKTYQNEKCSELIGF